MFDWEVYFRLCEVHCLGLEFKITHIKKLKESAYGCKFEDFPMNTLVVGPDSNLFSLTERAITFRSMNLLMTH